LKLSDIYAPVQKELTAVENQFQLIADKERGVFPDLYKMLSHILTGGKIIRPALTLLAGKFYNYDTTRLLPMATASELMHIATLVHDDAIDKSDVRRWRQTVNKIWGEDKAILLGDYLFARAGEYTADTESVRAVKLFTQTLATISQGELRQSFDAFKLDLSRDNYIARISRKTASLFAMAPEKSINLLRDYGYNLGIAFQVIDDILDFIGSEDELGKPSGSDLLQGTLSLPSMLLLKLYPDNNPIRRIFEKKGSEADIAQAIEMIRNSNIIEECYALATEYRDKACKELNLLPDELNRQRLINLADYVVSRKR
jgi:geranylgeranyl pyrophosphate synthase